MAVQTGWDMSAQAWIDHIGEQGDWGRRCILDKALLDRIGDREFQRALDVGCGEGRFCRLLGTRRIAAVGIDPTQRLLDEARKRDPDGDYRQARAEKLPFPDDHFDLVLSYVSLIDVEAYQAAINEMARVLAPGGMLLIANLTSIDTAGERQGWVVDEDGSKLHWALDRYLEEHPFDFRLVQATTTIVNWHRPLSAYMKAFLGAGLQLVHFDEPEPHSGEPEEIANYRRMPWFVVMEWTLP